MPIVLHCTGRMHILHENECAENEVFSIANRMANSMFYLQHFYSMLHFQTNLILWKNTNIVQISQNKPFVQTVHCTGFIPYWQN